MAIAANRCLGDAPKDGFGRLWRFGVKTRRGCGTRSGFPAFEIPLTNSGLESPPLSLEGVSQSF